MKRTYLLLKVGQNLGDDSVQTLGDFGLGKKKRRQKEGAYKNTVSEAQRLCVLAERSNAN